MAIDNRQNLGDFHHFLGMEVILDRKRRAFEININKYILDVLERFNMSDTNGRKAPMESSNLTTKLERVERSSRIFDFVLLGC
jgi:hypothetical protein